MVNLEALADHLLEAGMEPFGLVSHQATGTADFLRDRFGDQLAALFSPEHGYFGAVDAGEETASSIHPTWGIPVHSLYGATRKPTPEMLAGLGRIVFDLQDLGYRCYTYLATLKLTIEACAEAGIPMTIVDRPIPLGGILDGPMRPDPAYASFVAPINVPLCHGMTPGEAGMWIVKQEGIEIDLTVIRMQNWAHNNHSPWTNFIPPSPGIKSWDAAVMYPALVFTEAYPAIDCDRQGTLAFRVFGAPWTDGAELARELKNPLSVCGIGIRPYRYVAKGGQYEGKMINGAILSCEKPGAFYPVTAGVLILAAILNKYPEAQTGARPDWLAKLVGSTEVNDALASGDFSEMFQRWIDAQDAFLPSRVTLY